jgi:polysaccharide deacetylase 2 family uncharacterized protein YibQ
VNYSGFGRIPVLVCCLFLAAFSLSLAGCGKIKSAVESLLHRNRTSKTGRATRPPARVANPGPRLAIILDDVAGDPAAVDAIFSMHYPLTLSILPNHPRSNQIAQEAHRRGYQVMLHLPMESLAKETPESQELRSGMPAAEVSSLFDAMLTSVPYAVGVNNHQGSLATTDARLMNSLMPALRHHQLFFIDSRTTAATVAYDAAHSAGVPSAFRNVPFLDDVQEAAAIRRQLEVAVKDAREKGYAIAIGHPHPETLRALSDFLPQAEAQGIQLVHASELVR